MTLRKFIRLNFDGDVYSVQKHPRLHISKKDVVDAELDLLHFMCSQSGIRYSHFLLCNNECDYIYAENVALNFIYCMRQSKKLFKYHEKNIVKVDLLFPADDFKIFFIYSKASEAHVLSAFIHADTMTKAQEIFKKHMQELKELHPRKYKDLQCKFTIVHEI